MVNLIPFHKLSSDVKQLAKCHIFVTPKLHIQSHEERVTIPQLEDQQLIRTQIRPKLISNHNLHSRIVIYRRFGHGRRINSTLSAPSAATKDLS